MSRQVFGTTTLFAKSTRMVDIDLHMFRLASFESMRDCMGELCNEPQFIFCSSISTYYIIGTYIVHSFLICFFLLGGPYMLKTCTFLILFIALAVKI